MLALLLRPLCGLNETAIATGLLSTSNGVAIAIDLLVLLCDQADLTHSTAYLPRITPTEADASLTPTHAGNLQKSMLSKCGGSMALNTAFGGHCCPLNHVPPKGNGTIMSMSEVVTLSGFRAHIQLHLRSILPDRDWCIPSVA